MKNEVLSSHIFALCLKQHGRRYFSQHIFSSTKLFLDRKMGKTLGIITFKDVENLHTQQNPIIFNTLYFSITYAFSLGNKLTQQISIEFVMITIYYIHLGSPENQKKRIQKWPMSILSAASPPNISLVIFLLILSNKVMITKVYLFFFKKLLK